MDLQAIATAIRKAFSRDELTRLVRYGFGIELADYFHLAQGYIFILDEFLAWTEREGKTLDLLALGYRGKPGNPALAAVAQKFQIPGSTRLRHFDPAVGTTENPESLEALVARSSRLTDIPEFQSRFAALTSRVCRIDTGFKQGTGFLVGANLVLTNHHVMSEVIEQPATHRSGVRIGFDNIGAGPPAPGSICGLADDWLVASRAHSRSDETGEGEPEARKLDYALLRLDAGMGKRSSQGSHTERGWFPLVKPSSQATALESPLVARHDVVVVVQHPQGRPMQAAWGIVVEFAGGGTRVRYNVTTDPGSSGSPCLTADLLPFALHHAADPKENPRYNQGIPLALIAADVQEQTVTV